MADINSKIINCKGFIDWKQYNSINNIIKYNKKEIKNYNKILEKFRYLLEINKFTIDDFRIILFSGSEGVRFDLYGQFIDYNIIKMIVMLNIQVLIGHITFINFLIVVILNLMILHTIVELTLILINT